MNQIEKKKFTILLHSELDKVKEKEKIEEFLSNIIQRFIKESFKFYEEWNEFPFVYRERQLYSALIPAIYSYTNNIWIEQPFKSLQSKQRFLDIVTSLEENIYFIELKHSYKSKQNTLRKDTIEKWENAIKQINSIKKESVGAFYKEKFKQYKMALMIMPYFLSSFQKVNKNEATILEETLNLFKKNFKKEEHPNFITLIAIKEYKDYIHHFEDGAKKEVYPFLFFIAKVEEVT